LEEKKKEALKKLKKELKNTGVGLAKMALVLLIGVVVILVVYELTIK